LSQLNFLRTLLEQQQYAPLHTACLGSDLADPAVQVLLALACAHLGKREAAEHWRDQALGQADILDADARVDLAAVFMVFLEVEEATEALEAVQRELGLEGRSEHALLLARLAWCRMQGGRMDEARSLFARSAVLQPSRLVVFINLARLCLTSRPLGAEDALVPDVDAAQQAIAQGVALLQASHADWPTALVEQYTGQLRRLQLELWIASGEFARVEQWLAERRMTLQEDDWVGLVSSCATALAGANLHAQADELLREALKHYPTHLGLYGQLADLAQIQGQSGQALRLTRLSIELAEQQGKDTVAGWARLALACLHQFDQQARQAAKKAVALADALVEGDDFPPARIAALHAQAKNALAQVESQAQHFEVAETLFGELLADNPYFLPALQGLGQQQMQRGRIDEAILLFERIKQVDPAKGYSSLINARQFPDDIETLERMENAARQPSLEGSVRSGLLFQLAAAWEKRKDYAKAFALVVEANESSKRLLHYDAQAHRQRCARIRLAFSKALYAHRSDCGVGSTLPVFVLGMPRSGTTLVEQIIAGHSQIFGAGELGVIPSRIQGLNRWERHVGSGREFPDCVDDLTPGVTADIANGILDELKALAKEAKPVARFVVDKLPHNFENIGLIKFLFPNARIISVRRDPRDIAISNYFTDYQAKHGGMGFAYDLDWIGEQLADHNRLMHHWHQVFPGEILEINYEDVVENTEAIARKMLGYIGVEWESQVLNFSELERPVKTASVWQVRQPIYKTSTAKWMRYEGFLAPLIAGTNRKMVCDSVEMVTLPEPGLLTQGVVLYKADQLDEAEYEFKKLLHHVPDHAAANHLLGLIYARKNYLSDAIALMVKALEKCPWNPDWRKNLIQAYEMAGEIEKSEALKKKSNHTAATRTAADDTTTPPETDWRAWLQAGSVAPDASTAQT
jgi:tetratricopeptide (TPR) repeat protein